MPAMEMPNLGQSWKRNRGWIGRAVVLPFVLTRAALLLVGWFAQYLPRNLDYPDSQTVARGWQFSAYRVLDIWGRWDSGWYWDIVNNGYIVKSNLATMQSNLAFFPLYPYLVRMLAQIIPDDWRSPDLVWLIGILLSNLFLIGALGVLYKLALALCADVSVARRTVLFALVFPTGFFFSCFYAEAAFLFFTVAAFYAASQHAWRAAGLLGFCAALTRPLGILLIVPLALMRLQTRADTRRQIIGASIALALIPTGTLVYLSSVYPLTGNLLAPLQIQTAWKRQLALPWDTLIQPVEFNPPLTHLEQALTLIVIGLAIYALRRLPSRSYGVYVLVMLAPTLLSGTLMGAARHYAILFPIFIALAQWSGNHSTRARVILCICFIIQLALMAAWSQFYAIV